jgi:hypothetical protein
MPDCSSNARAGRKWKFAVNRDLMVFCGCSDIGPREKRTLIAGGHVCLLLIRRLLGFETQQEWRITQPDVGQWFSRYDI